MFSTRQDALINSLAIAVAAGVTGLLSHSAAMGMLAGIVTFAVALSMSSGGDMAVDARPGV
jgi:hypothetical protein